jgi:hypothetical protein
MSTIAGTFTSHRISLLRSSVIGGLIIGTADAIIYHWIITSVLRGNPLISVYQYIASGVLGVSAFSGGIATASLGLLFHIINSIVIASIFILSADRIPFLRRNAIVGSLLYGFGVFIVMNLIITPLSATPPLPAPTASELIVDIIDHVLVVGLPLGIIASRNANFKK